MHRKSKVKSYRQLVHCIISLELVDHRINTLVVVTVMRTMCRHKHWRISRSTKKWKMNMIA
jgi:hypothetical protein